MLNSGGDMHNLRDYVRYVSRLCVENFGVQIGKFTKDEANYIIQCYYSDVSAKITSAVIIKCRAIDQECSY